jgi:AcrR family transcriptional regulator/DNA-binding HxlR family transcriptional regulator
MAREELEWARAGVVARLRARRAEIDDAIFARVRDLAPDAVGLADPEYVAGLRAAIAAAVDFVLDGLERGEESGLATPSAVVVQARRAARVGVGVDTVLRRYVAGLAVLEDFIMQEVDHSALQSQRTALRRVLEASASLLDRLIHSVTSAYMQELERAGSAHHAPARGRRKQGGDSGEASTSDEHVVRDQRARIMRALAEVLAERGFAGATVGLVVTRARVSTRTFYQLFGGLEECLIAIMDSVLEEVVAFAAQELATAESWQDGVRSVLAALLSYFDREPELARVCIVETLAGGPVVLKHRERVIEAFRLPVIERIEREMSPLSPLAAEGVVSSVLGIMHAHIVTDEPGTFIELLGPLMALATAPYMGAWSVEREVERGDALARAILLKGDSRWPPSAPAAKQDTESHAAPNAIFFADLSDATARRARECVLFLAEHRDSSNREVGVGIDLVHQSLVSRLLTYLLQEGLVTKRSEGKGKRNAWRLTPKGEETAQAMLQHES